MGLLAVDVSAHGVVMSADSQLVEIRGGENRVPATTGRQTRNPIILRAGGGFVGVVGFAGTEVLEGVATRDWLEAFSDARADDDVHAFCDGLANALTDLWQRHGLESVLEILVAGEVSGDVQFWYVRNSDGLIDANWKHRRPLQEFVSMKDLDVNYVPKHAAPGESKDDLLARVMFSFRQGVLLPAAPVFDAYAQLLEAIYAGRVEGFAPLASLDDVGHYARVRMEFLKRLCTAKYGIYDEHVPTPIGGDVHVFGVGRDGAVRAYRKDQKQVKTVRLPRS